MRRNFNFSVRRHRTLLLHFFGYFLGQIICARLCKSPYPEICIREPLQFTFSDFVFHKSFMCRLCMLFCHLCTPPSEFRIEGRKHTLRSNFSTIIYINCLCIVCASLCTMFCRLCTLLSPEISDGPRDT